MSKRNTWALLFAVSALLLVACGSTQAPPPCDPEIEIKRVPDPYPVVVVIEMLPPLELEDVPEMVPDTASVEEQKENAIAIAEARDRNYERLIARDKAWAEKVKRHNESAADVQPPDDS